MREMFEGHLEGACGHQDHLRTRMRELEAEAQEATTQYQRATDLICSLQQQVTELKSSKASGLSAARSDQATLLSERATLSGENGTLCRDNGALNQAVKQLRADLSNQQRFAPPSLHTSAGSTLYISASSADHTFVVIISPSLFRCVEEIIH